MSPRVGDDFQKKTKYQRGKTLGRGLDGSKEPEAFKSYPGARIVPLDVPDHVPKATLWETLRKRRSIRHYVEAPLTRMELSQLLWAAQGVTAHTHRCLFRTAPSAGALYPVETYLVVNNVTGMERGIYHYDVREHRLELVREGKVRDEAARAARDQEMLDSAGVVFLWTAVFARTAWKYGKRAYRYVYLDAGHIAQNVALAAVALGLGTCQIAAFYDDEVNALVGVDGVRESAVYMTSVGRT
jgi:SagB-type dehydrogenase family enzyme